MQTLQKKSGIFAAASAALASLLVIATVPIFKGAMYDISVTAHALGLIVLPVLWLFKWKKEGVAVNVFKGLAAFSLVWHILPWMIQNKIEQCWYIPVIWAATILIAYILRGKLTRPGVIKMLNWTLYLALLAYFMGYDSFVENGESSWVFFALMYGTWILALVHLSVNLSQGTVRSTAHAYMNMLLGLYLAFNAIPYLAQ